MCYVVDRCVSFNKRDYRKLSGLIDSDSALSITKRWEAGWWRVGVQLGTMFYVKQCPGLAGLGWAGLGWAGCCNHSINLSSPLPLPDTNFNQQMSHWTRFFTPGPRQV